MITAMASNAMHHIPETEFNVNSPTKGYVINVNPGEGGKLDIKHHCC